MRKPDIAILILGLLLTGISYTASVLTVDLSAYEAIHFNEPWGYLARLGLSVLTVGGTLLLLWLAFIRLSPSRWVFLTLLIAGLALIILPLFRFQPLFGFLDPSYELWFALRMLGATFTRSTGLVLFFSGVIGLIRVRN